ncbi:MAG: hypothetical protein QM661_13710 [Solimonas sp.]
MSATRNAAHERRLLFGAGIAGVLGALGWTIGDVLIFGHLADRAAYPLLFQTHADRIDAGLAEHLVGVSHARLIAGALFAVFSIPFYLIGLRHLWQGIRGAGRTWTWPTMTLLFLGFAWSPLPHAAFCFVGATYQAVLASDPAAHGALLDLAAEFRHVLLLTYVPAVACQLAGMLAFSLAVTTGRTVYPRGFALTANPVTLLLVTAGIPHLIGGAAGAALGSAAFNTAWLLVYLQSLWLTRRKADAHGLPR